MIHFRLGAWVASKQQKKANGFCCFFFVWLAAIKLQPIKFYVPFNFFFFFKVWGVLEIETH